MNKTSVIGEKYRPDLLHDLYLKYGEHIGFLDLMNFFCYYEQVENEIAPSKHSKSEIYYL